jgi:uncharacterized membrane protein (TIGR02234 family)
MAVAGSTMTTPGRTQASRRQYGYWLLVAAAGAGLLLLALRRPWAQVTFTPPRPLPGQVISVSGQDLVPAAAALALAALACLAAVIATRGMARRVAGGLLAVLGAWAGISALVTVSAASAVSVAAGKVASPTSAAATGAAGSTTAGSTSSGSTVVVSGTAAHVSMTGGTWQTVAALGALLIVASGVTIAWRAIRRPSKVNAAASTKERADSPARQEGSHPEGNGPGDNGTAPEDLPDNDSATLWEALSNGSDPT